MRFPLEVIEVVRQAWPKDKPLFVRYSASDWAPEERNEATGEWVSWGIEQTRVVSKESFKRGVDLIDVSSGGGFPGQKIAVGPNYQVRHCCSSGVNRRCLYIAINRRSPSLKRSRRMVW